MDVDVAQGLVGGVPAARQPRDDYFETCKSRHERSDIDAAVARFLRQGVSPQEEDSALNCRWFFQEPCRAKVNVAK
ncbi:hypothetical protein IFT77_15460 [Frigoribacterium sp. CFBP 13729]|uniref:hypothetical protein n=1 Tax=Frigoribacterium sp. CFBP 13729 TaxID=2775293 RepID=UPI00177FD7F5|nr:hypothetical protein [Frigoribacterium sp. CFBP 13729]MBD8611886.1 hypothetical protein [Frigoribacterium sp. CFBP 13729]